ncbi:MAG: zinc-binding dehydrogenase [Betaproteobacteria bacterium]|nr:zinc-binding dehydrogenase [Betaproteobacteria bacterium]MBK9702528.1 zinc-binding dehydrogenase [Betaproteobacteria bacterium]MBL0290641.1 zinc-binding dehydrogenase [Betaproteobacteria bacterium]
MTALGTNTMKALVLTSPGAFEVREVAIPKPGQGEVLCRIRGVAICGSDPEIIRGGLAGIWPPAYPFIPGHEWSGEIVEVGDGVIGFTPGDRVAGEAHKGCGYCRNCLEGRYNLCENYGRPETGHRHYGFISQGAYAQYNAYSIRSVNLLPPTISFREGALVDTVGAGLHGLELAGVRPGGTVVIIGPGPIGLLAMRFATALGAARVIVVGRGARLKAAAAMGANAVVDIQQEDPVKAVRGLTDGLGVDLVCECSGAPGTFAQAVRMVRKGGKVSLVGVPPDTVVEELPYKYIVHNEIAIFGSRANPNVARKIIAMMAAGHIEVADLITHTFPLEDFAKGLDTFVNRRDGVIKVVIEPNGAEG